MVGAFLCLDTSPASAYPRVRPESSDRFWAYWMVGHPEDYPDICTLSQQRGRGFLLSGNRVGFRKEINYLGGTMDAEEIREMLEESEEASNEMIREDAGVSKEDAAKFGF